MIRKSSLMACAAIAAVALGASPSFAQLMESNSSHAGPYVSISGGGVFPSDSEFTGPLGQTDFDYDTGYAINGAVGYRMPVRVFGFIQPRVELEVGYLDADIDGSNLAFTGGGETFGDQSAVTLYVNSYADLRFSDNQRLVPYIGGGAGAAFLDFNARQSFNGGAPSLIASSDDTVFAGHAAVGATYELSDRLELFGEGRYFRFSRVDVEFVGPPAVRDDGRIDGYLATAGVRWKF